MEEESYKENDEERGKNSAQTGAECTRHLPYLVADKDADVGSKNAWAALRNGYQVDELVFRNPLFFHHYFVLNNRNHSITTTKRKGSNLEEGLEGVPVESFG